MFRVDRHRFLPLLSVPVCLPLSLFFPVPLFFHLLVYVWSVLSIVCLWSVCPVSRVGEPEGGGGRVAVVRPMPG